MNKSRSNQDVFTVIMRITLTQALIMVIMTSLVSAAELNGQGILDRKVSIDVIDKDIRSILNEIEKQASVTFTYRPKIIQSSKKVSLHVNEAKIGDVLRNLFGSKVEPIIVDEEILLRVSLETSQVDGASTENYIKETAFAITGKITDEKGEPLPGVNILEKGTTNGTSSDSDGKYVISVSDGSVTLVFSFIGYAPQEYVVNNQSTINVQLTPDIQQLSEVVIVAYGEQKKTTLTSSVSVVKSEDLNKAPVGNLSNALGGRASGIISRSTSGEPGADAPNILIRGVSSTNNNQPLYVVDGVVDRDVNTIAPRDIESITILKDASAVAPYGARGANGVILVTTRRGSLGKPTINYSFYYGVQKPIKLPQFAGSAEYTEMLNEAYRNVGQPEPFTAQDIEKYKAGNLPEYPNTNWYDEILQQNPVQSQHDLSVSGGGEKVKYFVSLGKFHQEGYWSNTDFNRYNLRSNIDADITKDLKISFDFAGNTSKKDSPVGGQFAFMGAPQRSPSINLVRNAEGQFVNGVAGNAVAELELGGYDLNRNTSFYGTLTAEYKVPFIKGLSFVGRASYDKGFKYQKTFDRSYSLWNLLDRQNATYQEVKPNLGPSLYVRNEQTQNTLLEARVNYSKTAGNHTIGALFVFTRQDWDGNWTSGTRSNFISASVDQLFAGPQKDQIANGSAYDGARSGLVGRLTYDYQSKYLFEANFRRDGSMNFPKKDRYGFFPSLAVGWRISEENFFKNTISIVNNLKIRGSWGKAGNDRLESWQQYPYLGTYGFASIPYSFGGNPVQGTYEVRLPNPDITWESATMTDVGVEGSLWNGILSFEADYFYKKTKDILRPTGNVSSIVGITLPPQNIGVVENKGIELQLGHAHQFGEFKYSVQFNYTYAKNKALELAEASGTLNDPIRKRTGRPLNQFFGYLSDGLFTSADEIANSPVPGVGVQPGDIKYKDINGPNGVPDGVITQLDETAIGYSSIPEIIYGLNIGAQYKGFDLTVFFQGAGHMSYWFRSFGANAFDNGGSIQDWQMENRYRVDAPNAGAKYPRLTPSPVANNYLYTSDYWLRDGTYWRLKTVQLGYTLNPEWLSKAKISNLRIYVSGQNLFTHVKDKLNFVDVEAGDNAGQFYPQSKVYTAGLNVSF